MPTLTSRRAALVAAAVACTVYVTALGNGWALDDVLVVRENPTAHSLGAALGSFFEPYWPAQPEGEGGLYRPLVTLSYAVDWTVSGGREWWFHLTNLLLHGWATALVVLVVLRWLPPVGALAAGLVFAVHPVHVEAVANVVGRAETMAACGILAAVLAARRYRRAEGRWARAGWLSAVLAAAAAALLSKEHAVVTVAVLAVDHALDPDRRDAPRLQPYLAVLALTLAWLFVWRSVASEQAVDTVAAGIRWLSTGERLATAFPIQLEALRLLVWPMRLTTDYSPLLIPSRTEWGLVAVLALLVSTALMGLALAVARRAPAVTFGILVAAGTYAPTSNIFFPSGVMLAERGLYLSALAPAAVVGWLFARDLPQRTRRLLLIASTVLLTAYSVRTLTRARHWRDTFSIVLQDMFTTPENYRTHVRAGEMFALVGDTTRALTEFSTAAELFPDPMLPRTVVPVALAVGRDEVALRHVREAYARVPNHAFLGSLLADVWLARGEVDSALAVARRLVELSPGSALVNETYLRVLDRAAAPAWQLLSARARVDWVRYRFAAAAARLDSAVQAAASEPAGGVGGGCWEVVATAVMLDVLRPGHRSELLRQVLNGGERCPDGDEALRGEVRQ